MKNFNNFVSLGYFCSIALDLERLGLRNTSSPFDWCISDFEGVINAIDNNFVNFLDYDDLSQNSKNLNYYKNIKYNIEFYHDFSKYYSLEKQLPKVSEKYERRISRFYKNICEPTLFIRYISNEKLSKNGVSEELIYIENNIEKITSVIKSFNADNEIIFIANDGVTSNILKIYNVTPDENDVVARKPIDKNKDLYCYLDNFDFLERNKNLLIYKQKKKKKKKLSFKLFNKCKKAFYKVFIQEYCHIKQH